MSRHNRSQTLVSHIKYVSLHHALKFRPPEAVLHHTQQEAAEGKTKPYGVLQEDSKKADTKQVWEQTQSVFLFQREAESLHKMD